MAIRKEEEKTRKKNETEELLSLSLTATHGDEDEKCGNLKERKKKKKCSRNLQSSMIMGKIG